jgi:hypothetical protein
MTAVPVLFVPPSGSASRPWLTPAMFKAYPTWLDTDNLINGGIAALQDDALYDALLAASDWAVGELGNMRLDAHLVSGEERQLRVQPGGRVLIQPFDVPVRAVISLSWGTDASSLNTPNLGDLGLRSGNNGWEVSFQPGWACGSGIFVTWSYVAGFPSALLAEAASPGDLTVTVDDPTGILPGDALRIYDPGGSEVLTVASSYVPAVPTIPPAPTAVPLAAAVRNDHAEGTGITGMPRRAMQAVIAYTVALLIREDVSGEEPVSPFGPTARTTSGSRGGQAAGLVNDARAWLADFRPPLRN